MNAIGIDPAPKKGATIYDPTTDDGWAEVNACDLPEHVRKLSESRDGLLLCWDAPLTAGKIGVEGCYYERKIERFFQVQTGWTAPKGISVRAYAGCPHWAVTRAALGLPRVGRFDRSDVPFALCEHGDPPSAGQGCRHIVEVHPAVAIWLWCRGQPYPPTEWMYKRYYGVREKLWTAMGAVLANDKPKRDPKNDDEFDAYVAYLLGARWLKKNGEVVLLGTPETGSFLVPAAVGLMSSFVQFAK